jgi:hypothetical protein
MTLRRLFFWFESAAASGLALIGGAIITTGVVTGDADYHGGAYLIILGLFLLIGAFAFLLGALGLRVLHWSGWLAQLFPAGCLALVLWDALSHPASLPW